MAFQVEAATHRALGPMVRLTLPGGLVLDLTTGEALILSRALVAVRDNVSNERQIFMSPIASDDSFSADRDDGGLRVVGELLDWNAVTHLADALARSAGGLGVDR